MATFKTCDSFLAEALQGIHQPGDIYKIAIYAGTATLSQATDKYQTAGEVSGAGYTAGGISLTKDTDVVTNLAFDGAGVTIRKDPTGHFAGMDWSNAVFNTVTLNGLKANGFQALIYNSTRLVGGYGRAVAFGTWAINELANDPNAANFTITLPGAGNVAVKLQG